MTAAHPLRGTILCLTALLLFACLDTTIKYLTASYDVPLVVAMRYIVNLLLMVIILAPTHGRQLVQTRRTGLVIVRALCLATTSVLVGFALQRMPLAETSAINFTSPMLVVLLARPLLGERIGGFGWAAVLFGFAGVLLIVRPGSGLDAVGVVCALGAAGANAAYQLLSRLLAATERTIALLFYTALTGAILLGMALPWFLDGQVPSPFEALLFVSLGVYGGLGHFLYTAAFRYASASHLAPLNYLQLLWAGLLGWLVFGHVPDGATLLGMGVVAASGIMIALKNGRPPVKRMV